MKYRVYYDPAFDSRLGRFFRAIGLVRSYECDNILHSIDGPMVTLHRPDEDKAMKIPFVTIVRIVVQHGANKDIEDAKKRAELAPLTNKGSMRDVI